MKKSSGKEAMHEDVHIEKLAGTKKLKEPAKMQNVSCRAGAKARKKGQK